MNPKLIHFGLSLLVATKQCVVGLAAAAALTRAVGQQRTVLGATDSGGIDRTVLPIEFLSRL
jgi:hypothetical protein